jgi:hypothetical protein
LYEVLKPLPRGADMHAGIYGIREQDHIELQRRRMDVESLLAYSLGNRLLVTVNHACSSLTGRRTEEEFAPFGLDFHGAGQTFTEISGVRNASEFVTALRCGQGVPRGESGNRWCLAVLSPLFAFVPLFSLVNYWREQAFAWYRGQKNRTMEPEGRSLSLRAVEL